jgi:hypothetical protein
MKKTYTCNECNYSTKRKYNLKRHNLKHTKRECGCGKKYKTRHGFYKHKKICNYELENEGKKYDGKKYDGKNVNIINNIQNNIQNNITNLSINLFLDKYCGDAKDLKDFIQNLQFTLEDIINTKNNGYVNGITNVVLKGLKNIPAIERPIHCINKKSGKLFIKDDGKWEMENLKTPGKTHNMLSRLRTKQWLSISKWEDKHPNWENNEKEIYERCKIIERLLGENEDIEKNTMNVIKNVADKINIKDVMSISGTCKSAKKKLHLDVLPNS